MGRTVGDAIDDPKYGLEAGLGTEGVGGDKEEGREVGEVIVAEGLAAAARLAISSCSLLFRGVDPFAWEAAVGGAGEVDGGNEVDAREAIEAEFAVNGADGMEGGVGATGVSSLLSCIGVFSSALNEVGVDTVDTGGGAAIDAGCKCEGARRLKLCLANLARPPDTKPAVP